MGVKSVGKRKSVVKVEWIKKREKKMRKERKKI